MAKITLYGMEVSPPTRATILTLKALNVPFHFKVVDLFAKEQHTPEFRKINSEGQVPVLEDDGHIVTDSHAIIAYLGNKYAKDDDSLYPKDPVKRSVVDQRLFYDMGVAFERVLRATARPIFQDDNFEIPEYKIDNIAGVYETVNNFLKNKSYVAGDHLTIADFSLVTTIISMAVFLDIDAVKYPKLAAWMQNLEKLPYFEEANGKGAKEFHDYMKSKNLKIVPYRCAPLKALNIPYEFKFVNVFEKEQDSAEYRRINPTGTVPPLDDNGYFIGDSYAINAYLVSKYGKNDALYPKDLVKRSIVDQRLHYDTGVVFERALRAIPRPLFLENQTDMPQYKIDNISTVYETVNNFLKDKPYVAGDHLTIADFSLISSTSSLQAYLVSDPVKYPNLIAWIKRLEKLPYYEESNGKQAKQANEMIKAKNLNIVP